MITIIGMRGKSRWTKQVQTILDIVYESEDHLSADKIYNRARQEIPNISLGTVYRNLKKLEEAGLINETTTNGISVFYKHPFNNAHFECEVCHCIIHVPVELNTFELERKIGLPVKKWNLHLTGICKECAGKCT